MKPKVPHVAGILVATLAAVILHASPATADDPHILPIDPATIDTPAEIRDRFAPPKPDEHGRSPVSPEADARCGNPAAEPVPDGEPILVSMPPAPVFTVGQIPASWWRTPPELNVTWRLYFESLGWIRPLAYRAVLDDQDESLATIVGQYLAFYQQNPDPNTTQYGWDEAAATRRLGVGSCLYALTGDPQLVPAMEADARVLLGSRYYGPPGFSIHNHGLMSNLELTYAAALIDRPAWQQTARTRMVSESSQSFSNIGISWEQSSMYQEVNAVLWGYAADVLAGQAGYEDDAAQIRTIVDKALASYSWMTEPDGGIVQIGDSDEQPGRPGPASWTERVLRDDQAGWVVGRWSWSDPAANYYTVRYGPGRRAHGHHDRAGGVTWSTRGVRVLVGPGRYSYDSTSPYHAYQNSPQAHNVAIPDGRTVTGSAYASITSSKVQAPAHAWNLGDTVYGIAHTRNINVNRDVNQMIVSDDFPAASLWRQSWHLDPDWQLTSGGADSTRLTFAHPSGRTLTLTTTGRVSSVTLGQTRPPAGWHFPRFTEREWAPEIVIRSYGRANTTTLVVS
ncbi:hypothetical protein ACFP2T_36845 [Plantactinospora solaniradicis]|uniref:Heparinase II/III-like protein n=1 Tax=Plantactinospora solaniradicis TaxID=1723736 RepID=A0ABW1KKC3_9ACTN